jgi:hypothetical protein
MRKRRKAILPVTFKKQLPSRRRTRRIISLCKAKDCKSGGEITSPFGAALDEDDEKKLRSFWLGRRDERSEGKLKTNCELIEKFQDKSRSLQREREM